MSIDPVISAYFSALGKRSASGMSAEQRRARAIKANRTRLEKRGLLTVSKPILSAKHTDTSKQVKNDLDRCAVCGVYRFRHTKYSERGHDFQA